MNLEEWRAKQKEGERFVLPSGLEVQLRRVSMLDLVEQGKVPATMRPQLDKMNTEANKGALRLNQMHEYGEVINLICRACLLAPDGLEVEELPFGDRIAIVNWANDVAQKLAPFRRQTTEPVDAALAGGDVRAETESLDGVAAG